KKSEDWEDGAGETRGAGGPIRVERARDLHPVAAALIDAGRSYGMPYLDDLNVPGPEGVGPSRQAIFGVSTRRPAAPAVAGSAPSGRAEHGAGFGPGPLRVVARLAGAHLPLERPDVQRVGPGVTEGPAQLGDARLVARAHAPALQPLVVTLARRPTRPGQ